MELGTALSGVYLAEPVVPARQVAGDFPAPQMLPSMQLPAASTCSRPACMLRRQVPALHVYSKAGKAGKAPKQVKP